MAGQLQREEGAALQELDEMREPVDSTGTGYAARAIRNESSPFCRSIARNHDEMPRTSRRVSLSCSGFFHSAEA
jgi:hypothetical protein